MIHAQMLRRPGPFGFDGFTPSLSLTLVMAVWTFLPMSLIALGIAFTFTPLGQRVSVSPVSRIVLDEGPCYGTCPGFTLAFDADGTIQYVGTIEVLLRGTYVATVPARYVERIAQALERHGLFRVRPAQRYIHDTAVTQISVAFADGTTATTTSYGEDPDVWEMARMLEGIAAGTCGWHFTHATTRPDVPPGSFSLISFVPCHRIGEPYNLRPRNSIKPE